MPIARTRIATIIGLDLVVTSDGDRIIASDFQRASRTKSAAPDDPLLRDAITQTRAYFSRRLERFDLPLRFEGTPLSREIYAAVASLSFGELVSYGEIARAIGHPGSHRAVAAAMGRSTLDLFVPAHRVIGADGRIKGAGEGSIRLRLLEHEGIRLRPG